MNMYNQEIIDAYLQGKLNLPDQLSFEEELKKNASLQKEVNLQKDIISQIQYHRKKQLKQQLDQVHVPSSYLSNPFTYVKIAAIISIVGFITYLAIQTTDKKEEEHAVLIKEKELVAKEYKQSEENTSDKKELNSSLSYKKKKNNSKSSTSNKSTIEEENTIVATTPTLPEEKNEEEINMQLKIEEKNIFTTPVKNSNVDVEIEKSSESKLAYSYAKSKLHLYGNFDQASYELLEFHGESQKIYLFFLTSYYELKLTQKERTPLVKITDKKIIRELDIARKSLK